MKFNAVKKALLATAVSSALVASANLASAADLDQLSDEDLLARIEALEKAIKGKGNVVLNDNKKIKLTLTGQVNNKVRFASNGVDSDTRVLDNNASSNRLRFTGKGKLNDRFSVEAKIEVDLERQTDSAIDVDDDIGFSADVSAGGDPNNDLDLRVLEAKFKDKLLGTLTIGAGDTASNKSFEADLSGSFLAVGDGTFDDDGISFVSSSNQFIATLGEVLDGTDGLSRQQRVRYQTPKFHGFGAEASFIGDRTYDAAVTVDSRNLFGSGFAVKGRAAYFTQLNSIAAVQANNVDGNLQSQAFTGSLAILHTATGLSLGGGYHNFFDDARLDVAGVADGSIGNYQVWFVKAGIQRKIFDIGSTAFAVDYHSSDGIEGDDLDISIAEAAAAGTTVQAAFDGFSARSIGVQLTQKIDKLSTEAYIGYRYANIDSDTGLTSTGAIIAGSVESINIVNAGARVKF